MLNKTVEKARRVIVRAWAEHKERNRAFVRPFVIKVLLELADTGWIAPFEVEPRVAVLSGGRAKTNWVAPVLEDLAAEGVLLTRSTERRADERHYLVGPIGKRMLEAENV